MVAAVGLKDVQYRGKEKTVEKYLQKQISNVYFLISSCNLFDVTWKKMSEVAMEETN